MAWCAPFESSQHPKESRPTKITHRFFAHALRMGSSKVLTAMTSGETATPAEILAFWRGAGRDLWYEKDDAFDVEVRRRYLDLWRAAAAGELSSWETSDDGALALTIVLDQFPRNMFRGDAMTFSSDA